MSDVLTPKGAAEYLGVHLITIYRMIKNRQLPAARVGGQWRLRKEWLNEFLEKKRGMEVAK